MPRARVLLPVVPVSVLPSPENSRIGDMQVLMLLGGTLVLWSAIFIDVSTSTHSGHVGPQFSEVFRGGSLKLRRY